MIQVDLVRWHDCKKTLTHIRQRVFVIEQRLPMSYQQDQYDAESLHVLAFDDLGNPVGTGRIKKSGHIGRLAVLMAARSNHVGSLIIEKLIKEAEQNKITNLHLHANFDNLSFYRKHQFVVDGPVFMSDGLPCQRMVYRPKTTTKNLELNLEPLRQHG
ncbi:MAG: GNAT family N-acetyltransferase [Gammaproteobacteria bacterium CG22_combo_CG10-13_8_21_14_all_40_8]|nr:MAG: GNAT family N-acetyltransferase [Gammaproteobacteria bacterium CG22_combo_CG10-13_8_21_14_all_40_8]